MNKLVQYILDCLSRYDIASVPGLGEFYLEYKPAQIHPVDHTFMPPSKGVYFRNYISEDNRYVSWVAEKEGISVEEAREMVAEFTHALTEEIYQNRKAKIEPLGKFKLTQNQAIEFEPNEQINMLDESFGLKTFASRAIPRTDFKEKAETQKKQREEQLKKKRSRTILAIVIIIPLFFIILGVILTQFDIWNSNSMNEDMVKELVPAPAQQAQVTEEQSQDVSLIPDSLQNIAPATEEPSVKPEQTTNTSRAESQTQPQSKQEQPKTAPQPKPDKNVVDENQQQPKAKGFFIIAGSFKSEENAQKLIKDLKAKGYQAQLVEKTKGGLYIVSYGKWNSRQEAETQLPSIKKENGEAWISHR